MTTGLICVKTVIVFSAKTLRAELGLEGHEDMQENLRSDLILILKLFKWLCESDKV